MPPIHPQKVRVMESCVPCRDEGPLDSLSYFRDPRRGWGEGGCVLSLVQSGW